MDFDTSTFYGPFGFSNCFSTFPFGLDRSAALETLVVLQTHNFCPAVFSGNKCSSMPEKILTCNTMEQKEGKVKMRREMLLFRSETLAAIKLLFFVHPSEIETETIFGISDQV